MQKQSFKNIERQRRIYIYTHKNSVALTLASESRHATSACSEIFKINYQEKKHNQNFGNNTSNNNLWFPSSAKTEHPCDIDFCCQNQRLKICSFDPCW